MSISQRTRELRSEGSPLPYLEKVARKAKRMFTRKTFYKPKRFARYRPLSARTPPCLVQPCADCERPCQGTVCRECFHRRVRQKFLAKVRADDARVRANEAAYLNVVTKQEAQMAAKKQQQITTTPITRSTSGLRSALFEEMEALRSGSSNAQRARSVAMMANSILQSVQVEIEYHKYVSANRGKIDGQEKVVSLGTDIKLAA
jgi:hypothetical protein